MRWILIVLSFALLTACGGGDDDGAGDAGEFSKQNIETMLRGQWARVYEDLHPEHQAIIPRDLYVDCQSQQSLPAYELEVDETYEETIEVSRLGEVETTAVTMKLTNGDNSEFLTRHLIDVDGEWKWISTAEALDAYEQGNCP
jgi:hypothetical protein